MEWQYPKSADKVGMQKANDRTLADNGKVKYTWCISNGAESDICVFFAV